MTPNTFSIRQPDHDESVAIDEIPSPRFVREKTISGLGVRSCGLEV